MAIVIAGKADSEEWVGNDGIKKDDYRNQLMAYWMNGRDGWTKRGYLV